MGRRESWEFADQAQAKAAARRLNPIWRGVGCVLLVLVSIAGYYFAEWFIQANEQNGWIYLPPQLFYPPFLTQLLGGGLLFKLVVAFIFMLFTFGVLNFVYALAFPIRPGEKDVTMREIKETTKDMRRQQRRKGRR